MKKTIYTLYDDVTSHIKYDTTFFNKVKEYRINWERKSDHISFLSSGTIGEQRIIYSIVNEEEWFQDVLRVENIELRKALRALEVIDDSREVQSNHKFHMIVFLIAKVKELKIKEEKANEYIRDIYAVFFFMKMSSLISGSRRFSERLADPNLAHATFENLPNRFIIKKLGNWYRVIDYVANDFFSRKYRHVYENGINLPRVLNPTDQNMLDAVTHMSTKLWDYVNNIYDVMIKLESQGIKGSTTSLIENFGDDGSSIRDVINEGKHVNFLRDIISVKTDFIRPRLVDFLTDTLGNVTSEQLSNTLKVISDRYLSDYKNMQIITEVPIIHGVNYLAKNNYVGDQLTDRIEEVLEALQNKWRVGKGQEKEITLFKEVMNKYSEEGTGRLNSNLLTSVTISVGLYIFIRAIVKNKV